MNDDTALTIDIVSDVVCPWCYLGKAHLERALESFEGDVIVRWHPYQLDPTIPKAGFDRATYMAQKFPNADQLKAAHERLEQLGHKQNLAFNFQAIKRSPNTLDAHRVIQWAQEAGVQNQVVTALFKAYFEEGKDIGDRITLADIAEQAGLDRGLVERGFANDVDIDAILAEIDEAKRIGVTGVPFFILDRRLAVSGAQPPEMLLEAMRQAQTPST